MSTVLIQHFVQLHTSLSIPMGYRIPKPLGTLHTRKCLNEPWHASQKLSVTTYGTMNSVFLQSHNIPTRVWTLTPMRCRSQAQGV